MISFFENVLLNKDRELIINKHVSYYIKFPDKVYKLL